MPDLKNTPPVVKFVPAEQVLMARAANLLREAAQRQVTGGDGVSVSKFGNRTVISSPQKQLYNPENLQLFTVVREFDDYLECNPYPDGTETVYVAKPQSLQRSPWDGVSFTPLSDYDWDESGYLFPGDVAYSYPNPPNSAPGVRTANLSAGGDRVRDESITPGYNQGDVLTATPGLTLLEVPTTYSLPSENYGTPTYRTDNVPVVWQDVNEAGRIWKNIKSPRNCEAVCRIDLVWTTPTAGLASWAFTSLIDGGLESVAGFAPHTWTTPSPGTPIWSDTSPGETPQWTAVVDGNPCWTPDDPGTAGSMAVPTPQWTAGDFPTNLSVFGDTLLFGAICVGVKVGGVPSGFRPVDYCLLLELNGLPIPQTTFVQVLGGAWVFTGPLFDSVEVLPGPGFFPLGNLQSPNTLATFSVDTKSYVVASHSLAGIVSLVDQRLGAGTKYIDELGVWPYPGPTNPPQDITDWYANGGVSSGQIVTGLGSFMEWKVYSGSSKYMSGRYGNSGSSYFSIVVGNCFAQWDDTNNSLNVEALGIRVGGMGGASTLTLGATLGGIPSTPGWDLLGNIFLQGLWVGQAFNIGPVPDGTYTVGAKLTPGGTDGTITTQNGIITAVSAAT